MNIKSFMNFYREVFSEATVFPKMHILEQHVPLIKKWNTGFGKQGAESIYAYFNSLTRTYWSISDPVMRMEHTMWEHLLHIVPASIDAKPAIKRR